MATRSFHFILPLIESVQIFRIECSGTHFGLGNETKLFRMVFIVVLI